MGKYLEKNLNKDEQIILKAKVSVLPHLILMIFIIGFFTIWKPLFARLTTELGITNKKIVGKTGFIHTSVLEAPLNKIDSVTLHSGLAGKIFGYGHITISTASRGFSFFYIAKAENFRVALMKQIDDYNEEKARKQAEEVAKAMRYE